VCIHVDDLLITCLAIDEIERVIQGLKDKYKTISAKRGVKHSYLGISFDFSERGKVRVTMEGYIADVLRTCEVSGKAATPATEALFTVSPDSALLDTKRKETFYSHVAKLLYLSKRASPELLTGVTFLATRVTCSTEEDWGKLDRLLRYLNSTPDMGLVLQADKDIRVRAYIDVSYGVHGDAKSHTGVVITLGNGPVFVKSSKQKVVSKSSTEGELIGLSDGSSQVIWSRDLLLAQGHEARPALIFQDNQSTMALANKGRSTSERTRHIHIRYFWVKDRIDSGEIELQYLPTKEMIADILTKPLQGELFRTLRAALLNA
jgi:hypothetical protein